MNILKAIAQPLVNAALPGIKADLKLRAANLASQPKYAAAADVVYPFVVELIDAWTIKL